MEPESHLARPGAQPVAGLVEGPFEQAQPGAQVRSKPRFLAFDDATDVAEVPATLG